MTRSRRRILVAVLILVATAIALRALLPAAISAGLKDWLETAGASEVAIDSLELDLVAGRAALRGLRFEAGGRPTRLAAASLQFSWLGTDRERLWLENVSLAGLQTHVRVGPGGEVELAGLHPPSAEATGSAKAIAVLLDTANLTDLEIDLLLPKSAHRLRVESMRLGFAFGASSSAVGVSVDATVDSAALVADAVWADDGRWQTLDTRLDLEAVDLSAVAAEARLWEIELPQIAGLARARVDAGWRREAGKPARASGAFELAIATPGLVDAQFEFAAAEASAKGNLAWSTGTSPEAASALDLDGELSLTATTLKLPTAQLLATVASASWRGRVSQAGDAPPRLVGTIGAGGLRVEQAGWPSPALVAGRIAARELVVDGAAVDVAQIEVSELDLFGWENAPPEAAPGSTAHLGSGRVDRLRFADATLAIDRVGLSGLRARVVRTASGRWLAPVAAASPSTEAKDSSAASPADDPPLVLRVGRLALADPARIALEDRTVTPAHRRDITVNSLLLADFDSAGRRPATVELAAVVDRHASIRASGSLATRPGKPVVELKVDTRSLELPPLAGYLVDALGQTVTSGQLDAASTVRVEQGQLAVDNALTLRQLELRAGAHAEATTGSGIGMPIDTALTLLRDRHGDIKLELPVRGTLDDPKFDLGNAIRSATGKAMQFAALSYVKQMIQPFGALVTLAEFGADQLTAVRLEPMRFSPGLSTFDGQGIAYLEKLASLLNERPKMRLRICGKAWSGEAADIPGARALAERDRADRLRQLAQARGEAIKGALAQAHGVAADRLFLCQPEVGDDQALAGRADLGI